MGPKKTRGGYLDSQMAKALQGIKIEETNEGTKSEAISHPVEIVVENVYEKVPVNKLLEQLQDRQNRYDALQKIEAYLIKQSKNDSVRSDELLKYLRENHLLKQSGIGKELQRRIEQADYQELYHEISKLIEDLKTELREKIPQAYDPNKKDAGFAHILFVSYGTRMKELAAKLSNPIAAEKMQTFFADVFGEESKSGEKKFALASNALLGYLRKASKVNPENLQEWLDGFLDYYQAVTLENLANLKESFNADMVKTKQLSDETIAAKMGNKHLDLKLNLASLENFLRSANAADLQENYFALQVFLKNENYLDVLSDKDVKQDFVETIDKGEKEQQELKQKLGHIKNAMDARVFDKTSNRSVINAHLRKWMDGETTVPPNLDLQSRLNANLKEFLTLIFKFFEKKCDKIIREFKQAMRTEPERFAGEKEDFDRFVTLWNKHRSAEKLGTFNLYEQKELMGFLVNRDWLSLIDKFSLFSLMDEKKQISNSEKIENNKSKEEVTNTVEQKDLAEDVLALLEKMEDKDLKHQDVMPDTQKLFSFLYDQMLATLKKDKNNFTWKDALKMMDDNDKGFFKGLLNHLLVLPQRIIMLDDKLGDGMIADDVLNNLEERYNQILSGLFKYEPAKNRLTFDRQVRHKIDQMNALYFNKLFKLLNRDLEKILQPMKSKLSKIVNPDGSINEKILDEILEITKK